jgi:hypothetical protein
MFFISYSSADETRYIRKFFDDLRNKVARLLPDSEALPAFLDKSKIKTGEDWELAIKDGLLKAKILVCIYSPQYFNRHGTGPNFCAREVLAFVKRHRQVKLENEEGERVIRGPTNLIPILWCALSDLEAIRLPPPLLKYIEYTLSGIDNPDAEKKYLQAGLLPLVRYGRGNYDAILTAIARVIRQRVYSREMCDLLEELSWLESGDDSFWTDRDTQVLTSHQAGQVVEEKLGSNLGPQQVLIIQIALGAESLQDKQDRVDTLCQVANGENKSATAIVLGPHDQEFPSTLSSILATASAANSIVLVILDQEALSAWADGSAKAALCSKAWTGGVLLIGEDHVQFSHVRNELMLTGEGKICIRQLHGDDLDSLRSEFSELINDVTQKIFMSGQVYRDRLPNDGPDRKPTLMNTIDQANG